MPPSVRSGGVGGYDCVIAGAGSAGCVLAVVTRGNTHAPTVMIPEKAASLIRAAAVG
jgi:choline dehydrogenase-like flavoprotein